MRRGTRQSSPIEMDLENAWNRKLYDFWHSYNHAYLTGAMRVPTIRLGLSNHELGHWEGRTRTLTMSRFHIERDPWLSVMNTLRHEMAHQYVDEVLNATNERPHGRAFHEGCERLRCSPRARATQSELRKVTKSSEDKILRTLKKVLSLADSPNEHEAQAAVQKARFLLVKYHIDVLTHDEERGFENRYLGEVKKRHTSAELCLGSILNEFFFVEVIWQNSYDARRDKAGTVLHIFGTPPNLDMAEYVHTYLHNLLDGLWEEYKARNGLHHNRDRQRYFAGVVEGFNLKLREQEQTLQDTRALVWKSDAKLKEYFQYLNPYVHTSYSNGVTESQAYEHGVQEGRRVTIHKPITATSSGFGGYLEA